MQLFISAVILLLLAVPCYTYSNPVQGERDSPDPGVIYYNGSYYAATTEGWDGHYFPIWKSDTGTNFTQVGWVMPSAPSWTRCCDYWAPEIHIIDSKFTVFYTATSQVSGKLSIGVTQSSNILGPYVDKGAPIMTNATDGIIDPTVLSVGATKYLVYKVNNRGNVEPSYLFAIQLAANGTSVGGPHTMLLKSTEAWEDWDVEAPWFVKSGNYWYLFYSGCSFDRQCYSVGVARSINPLGPYQKRPLPILKTRSPQTAGSWLAPGHCSVIRSPSNKWLMFYHAWPHGEILTKRVMLMDEVKFVDDWPTVFDGSPSETTQPNP